MISSVDVLVLSKETRQCLADMRIGESADFSRSVWSGIVEKYFFKFFNGICYSTLFFYVYGL